MKQIGWLIAWTFYSWAHREIHPQHPDVLKVNMRRMHYARLLGFRDSRDRSEEVQQRQQRRYLSAGEPSGDGVCGD